MRGQIEEMMTTQDVLLDAHDVIGSAAPVLVKAELDPFTDMQVCDRESTKAKFIITLPLIVPLTLP